MTHSLSYIVQDVRTFQVPNKVIITPHCCNNLKVIGAGVAKALKTKWPQVFDSYYNQPMNLGGVFFVPVEFDEFNQPKRYIVNMIGQDGVRSKDNPKPVKYSALLTAMTNVNAYINLLKINNPFICTVKFGSDLAGGEWKLIEELIKETWLPKMDVVVCCLTEDDIPIWHRN